MPVPPTSNDQPSTAPPYADVLGPNRAPALSARSDMPQIAAPEPDNSRAVDNAEKPSQPAETSDSAPGAAEGEADAQPKADKAQEGGEEGSDKTSPQQRAAFARERNRRLAAEQRATNLETKVDQLIEVVSKLTPKEEPKEDPRPAMPRRDAFDTPDAYEKALGTYDQALEGWASRRATETATREAEARQAQQQRDRQAQTQREAYEARQAEFVADHPDFEDVVFTDDLKISPAMTIAIMEAEDGPAIAYHLGQNPEVAERLAKLSPAQAVYEIGKISARLSAPPPRPRAEPIRPLAARNSAGPKSPNDMTMDEYAEWRKSKTN